MEDINKKIYKNLDIIDDSKRKSGRITQITQNIEQNKNYYSCFVIFFLTNHYTVVIIGIEGINKKYK